MMLFVDLNPLFIHRDLVDEKPAGFLSSAVGVGTINSVEEGACDRLREG